MMLLAVDVAPDRVANDDRLEWSRGNAEQVADVIADGVAADTGSEDQLDREALAKLYDELFGHRPNGKWGAPKIKQLIDEKLTEG